VSFRSKRDFDDQDLVVLMKSQGKSNITSTCSVNHEMQYRRGFTNLVGMETQVSGESGFVGLVAQVKKWKISGCGVKSFPLFNHSLRFRI